MLNLLKAELFRIFKSTGFKITIGSLILITWFFVATELYLSIGVNPESSFDLVWNGYNTPIIFVRLMNILQYFFLPILVIVVGHDFSHEVYKNNLGRGLNRIKYYIVKLVTIYIVCFIIAVLFLLIPSVIAVLKYGFKGNIDKSYIFSILKPFFLQLLNLYVIISVAAMILFITKKTTACTIGYLVFPMAIQIGIALVMESYPKFGMALTKYEVISAMSFIALGMESYSSIHYLSTSIAYILFITLLGIYLFNKVDLK